MYNRNHKVDYDTRGDIIRYAGDILDYMVLANLLRENHGYYSLNGLEAETISSLIISDTWFDGYDEFYGRPYELHEIEEIRHNWFEYVNANVDPHSFNTDISEFVKESSPLEYSEVLNEKILGLFTLEDVRTKDIGDIGETLVVGHEKMRAIECGLKDFIHLIKKIPTSYAVGYDIQSLEGTPDKTKRYIEVKSTISKNKLHYFSVHLTTNEWESASTLKEHYFIYRLMISTGEMYLYILKDPVSMYKNDKITMIPRDGADLGFSEDVCEKVRLKIWQQ